MSLVSNRPNFGFNPGFAASSSHSHAFSSKGAGKDANPLEDLLIKTGRGGAMLNPSKKESLEKVAAFMDKHPEVFGKPEGRQTWLSELKEDNFLNGKEANKFSGAIDMMKDATGAGGAQSSGVQGGGSHGGGVAAQEQGGKQNFDNALIPSGNGESVLNPSKKNELESVAKFMDQHPDVFGKPDGRSTWLSELKEDNQLNKSETKGFSNAIDMMKDAQGAFGSGEAEETNGAGASDGSDESSNVGQSQPQGTSQSQTQGQGQGGLDLKNTLVETGKGDSYLNPTKKNELEAVAKFMDQHPETFGKPDGKESWLSELKEDNYLDKNETKGFKKAIDMMQDAGAGSPTGNAQQTGGAGSPQAGAPDSFAGGQGGFNPDAGKSQGQGDDLDLKDALVQTGKGDAFLNPSKKNELESVAKFMDQHPDKFGKPDSGSWLSELKEDNYLNKKENKAFSSAIDLMQDARGAGVSGGSPQSGGANQSTPVAAEAPPSTTPGTEKSQGQGSKANLDDVLVQTGKGDAYFNPSKKAEMESVAKFMDQRPDKFGKPDSGSWLSELKEDNYLDKKENKAFSSAIDVMKDARNA